jgi:hypothetical protein
MPEQQQEPIEGLEACRVKFVDVALDAIDDPPGIDDEMTFAVTAVCVARTRERMKDGELRNTAKMRVTSLEATSGAVKPTGGPNLFSVDDDDD